eukprot:4822413-Amphidinium_carterae.1
MRPPVRSGTSRSRTSGGLERRPVVNGGARGRMASCASTDQSPQRERGRGVPPAAAAGSDEVGDYSTSGPLPATAS